MTCLTIFHVKSDILERGLQRSVCGKRDPGWIIFDLNNLNMLVFYTITNFFFSFQFVTRFYSLVRILFSFFFLFLILASYFVFFFFHWFQRTNRLLFYILPDFQNFFSILLYHPWNFITASFCSKLKSLLLFIVYFLSSGMIPPRSSRNCSFTH